MIENEHQYNISKKLLQKINESIDELKNTIHLHPLRNKLILASAYGIQEEIENDIVSYQSFNKNQSS
jgi:hypothetical protein